jgi:hypothetical protein
MKVGLAVLAAALMLLTACSASVRADAEDPGAPQYTNNMFGGFVTPTVSPGKTVNFAFNLTNPYGPILANPYTPMLATMNNITLTVGIYEYATQETVREVNSSFTNPPLIQGLAPQLSLNLENLTIKKTVHVELPINTTAKTPHGSYFSQSTYFVRFKLIFNLGSDATPVVLQSKGFFTDAQWSRMVSFTPGQEIVDTTYMKSLGVDGLIPDSSFGIKVPIPRWPLALLIAACGGVSLLALYYFVLDNPGKYPRLEKRAYYLRGKLSELGSHLKNRP